MLAFSEKVKLETSDLVMTYRAKNAGGQDFFAYILCNKEQVIAMKSDFATKKAATPESYGEVIYADFLENPDEKAKAFLAAWLTERGGKAN